MGRPIITNRVKKDNSKEVVDISWNGMIFNGVEIPRPRRCKRCTRNGSYPCYTRDEGSCSEKREFKGLNIFSTVLISSISFWCFYFAKIGIIFKILFVVIAFILLNLLCAAYEKIMQNIWKKRYYKKIIKIIKKALKRKEKGKDVPIKEIVSEKEVEKKKELEEKFEASRSNLQRFKDFYGNDTCRNCMSARVFKNCESKLDEIMKIIIWDMPRYHETETIWEEYLPRVCNILEYFSNFMKGKDKEENQEIIDTLNITLNNFSEALNNPIITPILSNESDGERIKVIAEEIDQMLEKTRTAGLANTTESDGDNDEQC